MDNNKEKQTEKKDTLIEKKTLITKIDNRVKTKVFSN